MVFSTCTQDQDRSLDGFPITLVFISEPRTTTPASMSPEAEPVRSTRARQPFLNAPVPWAATTKMQAQCTARGAFLQCATRLSYLRKSRGAGVRQQTAWVSMLGNPTKCQNGVLPSPAEALRSYLAQAVLALEFSQSCLYLLKALQ